MSMELENWEGVTIEVAPSVNATRPYYSVLYKKDGKVIGGSKRWPLGYISEYTNGITPADVPREMQRDGYNVPDGVPVTFVKSQFGYWISHSYYEDRVIPKWY